MSGLDRPLVIGAGPVGLGAALLLQRQGLAPRVVEPRAAPSRHSRALAINPRTLELLAPTGVSEQLLAAGARIRGARFEREGRLLGELDFRGLHPEHPYMLALSQSATERILERAFEAAGGRVERGVALAACRALPDGVEAELERTPPGARETVWAPWLVAADGAHSPVRRALAIDFPGSSFAVDWHLVDVPLHTDLDPERGHVCFLAGGALVFALRVVDPDLEGRGGAPVWRVISNRPEPLARLPRGEPAGDPLWASSFAIAHRVAARLRQGEVYLAGDAAHVHSPLGARGMNLGLEDVFVLAELERVGRRAEYHRVRRPAVRRVVRRVEALSRVAAAESWLTRLVRRRAFPLAIRVPALRRRARRVVTGLDEPRWPGADGAA